MNILEQLRMRKNALPLPNRPARWKSSDRKQAGWKRETAVLRKR